MKGGTVVGTVLLSCLSHLDTSCSTLERENFYLGSQMIAVQASGVNWVCQDPVTKSQRVTDNLGNVVSTSIWIRGAARRGAAAIKPSNLIATPLTNEIQTAAMKR